MKRAGHLIERIAHQDNLAEAFLRAARGKGNNQQVMHFRNNINNELEVISEELLNGTYRFSDYYEFIIFDPKKRKICAAAFRDRVTMHAMMRICHPVFDAYQISDSYASRVGKGTYKALSRAQRFLSHNTWYAKLDMCRYFDSINHDTLLEQLNRLFKDKALMAYFEQLVRNYETTELRGLPIGNLTSQYFANHYLSVADHYLKERLHAKYIIRYMDDLLLFDSDRDRLRDTIASYREYVEQQLKLYLHNPVVNKTRYGIPFLGYVLFNNRMHLNQRSRRRFRNRLMEYENAFEDGHFNEADYHKRLTSLYAFATKANVTPLMKRITDEFGILP